MRPRPGRPSLPRARFEEMLRLYRSAGNGMGEAHALRRIAGVELELGRYGEALRLLEQALPTFHAIGDRLSEAVVRMRMGSAWSGRSATTRHGRCWIWS